MVCTGLARHYRIQGPVLIQPFSGAHPPPGDRILHHLPSRTMRALTPGGDGGVTQSLCRLSARYQPVYAPRMARHGDCVHCQPAGAEPRGLQPLPDGEGLSCALSLRSAPRPPPSSLERPLHRALGCGNDSWGLPHHSRSQGTVVIRPFPGAHPLPWHWNITIKRK